MIHAAYVLFVLCSRMILKLLANRKVDMIESMIIWNSSFMNHATP